jgi:hypothetical protein
VRRPDYNGVRRNRGMDMLRIAGSIEEVEAAHQAHSGKQATEKLLAIKGS